MFSFFSALETSTIERFASPGNYATYARCVKSEKTSNKKYKGQGNKKNGNKYLAWAFMEAGHYGVIWDPRIKRFYQRKQAKAHILVAKIDEAWVSSFFFAFFFFFLFRGAG